MILSIKLYEMYNISLEIEPIKFMQESDLYYFELINGHDRALSNFVLLLKKWVTALKNISNDTTFFLPFDFSDQYVGGLKIVTNSITKKSILSYVYSTELTGYDISPLNLNLSDTANYNLQDDSEVIEIDIDDMVDDIEKCIFDISDLES